MTLPLGQKLRIRSMVYVAGETIPFFWPMRSFIHHNPLHGLEKLSFHNAAKKAKSLFHAQSYLPRAQYQRYLQQGKVELESLRSDLRKHLAGCEPITGIDLETCLFDLLTREQHPVALNPDTLAPKWVHAALQGQTDPVSAVTDGERTRILLKQRLPEDKPVYEIIDLLFGTELGAELDELVIKSCLEFFDEGQSVWGMPEREQGFFSAWLKMATRNAWISRRARHIRSIVGDANSAESVIERVLRQLQVPEEGWQQYIVRELSRLHGWVGFIRWRENTQSYHWSQQHPGDLVDYLAVRLVLSAALLREQSGSSQWQTVPALRQAIEERTFEVYLRYEFYSGRVVPKRALQVEKLIASADEEQLSLYCQSYWVDKQHIQGQQVAQALLQLTAHSQSDSALRQLDLAQLEAFMRLVASTEQKEGLFWLRAMEAQARQVLAEQIRPALAESATKRPFVQALFCIDTRSERIRRQLEGVGDYQTFGIAGFFGVPFSFMALGKGSENHLCPVLITPKNLVLEISRQENALDLDAVSTFEKVLHELKESILTPFVTVEAVGLLFGFDMVGKTLAPRAYQHWRQHLHSKKPPTNLLIDKMSRVQADSIVRAVQRAVILHAIEQELDVPLESVTDQLIRELRECALEHEKSCPEVMQALSLEAHELGQFIVHLREFYKINDGFARFQMERLGRIGFSLDEQVGFVSSALRMIGLTGPFSRFVLLVGHGSSSENNPYESALDCGACGGAHGLVNARVLAQMANKPQVRERLREQGLDIAEDVWFLPVMHNTTTDELTLHDLELLPSTHLIYLERLRAGLRSAKRLCAQERLPTLQEKPLHEDPAHAFLQIQRNAVDWSQVRPEWGLSGNLYFIIGQRELTRAMNLQGRSFLHSYDYRVDPKQRLLQNILGGPLVVGQWINMEHYFSTVDNERFGSGSKVYHNVAGRFGVMSGNLSDLRTGLPAQTVLYKGQPYHEPIRLITVIQAPFDHAVKAIEAVASVARLVRNHWVRLVIVDPQSGIMHSYEHGDWTEQNLTAQQQDNDTQEARAS